MNCTVAQSRRFHMSRSSYNLDLTGTVEQSRRFHMSRSSYNLDLTGVGSSAGRREQIKLTALAMCTVCTAQHSTAQHSTQSSQSEMREARREPEVKKWSWGGELLSYTEYSQAKQSLMNHLCTGTVIQSVSAVHSSFPSTGEREVLRLQV